MWHTTSVVRNTTYVGRHATSCGMAHSTSCGVARTTCVWYGMQLMWGMGCVTWQGSPEELPRAVDVRTLLARGDNYLPASMCVATDCVGVFMQGIGGANSYGQIFQFRTVIDKGHRWRRRDQSLRWNKMQHGTIAKRSANRHIIFAKWRAGGLLCTIRMQLP